ncbi:MAG: hydantoinase B/oxoprolinase family protein [Candidatus Acetothermia bacterium]|nr:hydantoinase B/oxoprolinase family protein [Candidatus Acetothermia bacterium]
MLDPTTNTVLLYGIPTDTNALAITVGLDGLGNVWFTDRAGDAVGYLSPARSEITLYGLVPNSHPVFLALDEAEDVWFTAERGNFVGRLSVVPVLGEPPALPSGVMFTGYSVVQVGDRAWVSVSYTYDGGHGVPVWVGVEVLAGGEPGAPGENVLVRDGEEIPLPGKAELDLRPGEVLSVRTPGGGGYGREEK